MDRDSVIAVAEAPIAHPNSQPSPVGQEGKSDAVAASASQADNGHYKSLYHHIFYDSWIPELVAMLFSVMCLVALVGLLIAYQNERLENFRSTLSINTVVVILSTAARTSLAFVVTSALGQAKWCWIARRAQRLEDLQDLDAASRGPLGSLLLLFTNKSVTLSINSLGALILIFTVGIDPFSQQTVATPLRLRQNNSTAATLKTSTNYPSISSIQSRTGNLILSRLVQNSLWNGALDLDFTCPSGDCIWPEYEYVGWCSECEVVQDPPYTSGCSVSVKGEDVFALLNDPKTLPCNFTLEYSENTTWPSYVGVGSQAGMDLFITMPTSFITSLYSDPSDYDSARENGRPTNTVKYNVSVDGGWFETPYKDGLLAGMLNPRKTYTAASIDWTIDQDEFVLQGKISQVTECGLTPCLKRVQAETRNATIYSTIKSKKLLASYYPQWIGNYLNDRQDYFCFRNFSDPPPDYDFGTRSSVQWDNGTYRSNFSDKQNRTFCVRSSSGWWSYDTPLDQGLLGNSTAYSISRFITGIVEQPWRIGESTPYESGSSITYTLLNESRGLQSALHSITTAMDVTGLRDSNDIITGEMSENVLVIIVRWPWLTLPIVLELLSIIFFVMVVVQTKQRGVSLWKASVLPFVLGGLERDSALELEDFSQPKTTSQMHHLAELTRVSLKRFGTGSEQEAKHDRATGEGL